MNNPNLIRNLHKVLLFIGGGIGYHYVDRAMSYSSTIAERIEQQARVDKLNRIESSVTQTQELLKSISSEANTLKTTPVKPGHSLDSNAVNKVLEDIQGCWQEMSSVANTEYLTPEGQNKLLAGSKNIEQHCEQIQQIIESSNKDSFISWINQLNDYLNSISLLQESAILHVFLFLILIVTVVNILAALLGNEIIKYFNLESRFPRLAIFFRLRTTFQRYYLLWNIFVLVIICFFGIFINVLVLL
uniref:LAGLIDADG homing endonuclease n=1 Tax=Phanerochaete carnosa TaxID=231932 RepID=A0A895KV36_9APHY|nr:LAGLIDADG homing endonuclease [Phanerochaete carnosa]QRZ60397.1 LAGLIDADG homing endonuclease [Phanerochaete carnosa]